MSSWGLSARPSWLVVTNDRSFTGPGKPYQRPSWYCDHWLEGQLDVYRNYWKHIGPPDIIQDGALKTYRELASLLGVTDKVASLYLSHGAIRHKDFRWDIDILGYAKRCEVWEEARTARADAIEAEKQKARETWKKDKKAASALKPKLTKADYTKKFETGRLARLKNSVEWIIRGDEIKHGFGRVYLDGKLSTREYCFQLLKWPEMVFQRMLKIGNFRVNDHLFEFRNVVKSTEKKVYIRAKKINPLKREKMSVEEKREKDRARKKKWLLEHPRKPKDPKPKKEVVVKSVMTPEERRLKGLARHKERLRVFRLTNPPKKKTKDYPDIVIGTKFDIVPYDAPIKSKGMALHLNDIKTAIEEITKKTGVSGNRIRAGTKKGILVGDGFRIELKAYDKKEVVLRDPVIAKGADGFYTVRLCYKGKQYRWYSGPSLDKATAILNDILKDGKWKEKING